MVLRRIRFVDNPETEENKDAPNIPEDDGHQMSQNEIDNLIAMLLNQ